MALRLRRGTDAERQLITPLQGELIYTTDTKLLYVGDGTTAGGTLVTGAGGGGSATLDGLTDTDLTGASNNDVLTYNSATNKWEAVAVAEPGALSLNNLSDVFLPETPANGAILRFDGLNFTAGDVSDIFKEQQNYKINIVGDDSTIIINTDTNNVTGNFFGNLTGNTNGTHTGAVIGNVTGNLEGNVTGNLEGNVLGTVFGKLDGDMTGSVFADDSTLLVDGVSGTIVGDIETASLRTSETKIALGENAGLNSQGTNAVAVGRLAGETSQGAAAVAVGAQAGETSQGVVAVAVGRLAGNDNQGNSAVAVGVLAGQTSQSTLAVAVGAQAGETSQGEAAVAIGYQAGFENQANNSIVLNATGAILNQTTANTFTVKPVRAVTGVTFAAPDSGSVPASFFPMYYNTITGEIIVITD